MRLLAAAAAAVLFSQANCAGEIATPDVSDTSRAEAGGTRLLQDSIIVAAPSEKVWAAFVDPETIRAWSAPMAVVDLRQGGLIEEGFTPSAKPGSPDNIRHRIIACLPEHLLVLRNENAPRGLPGGGRYKDVLQIVEIESVDRDHTRVRLSQTGYGNDAEFDKLYGFFAIHNPQFLEQLKSALEKPKRAQTALEGSHSAE